MSELIKDIIKAEKPHLIKYSKYIKENPWGKLRWNEIGKPKNDIDVKKEEFDLQNSIITTLLSRLKILVKRSEGSHHLKIFKDFVLEITKLMDIHIERANAYTYSSNLTEIESTELRSVEIAFHRHLHFETSKIQDIFKSFDIKMDENSTDGILFLDKQKASISMWKMVVEQYPAVKEKLKKMKIDFDSDPPPTLHILNENPPVYDDTKHFFQNSPEIIQYYVDEWKKIDRGLTIDGYYIDGWLYFHFNYFVTNIPTTVIKGGIAENEDVVKVPELRDNEILMTNYFIKSKRESKMSLIAATRRAAKTTLNSSRIIRAQILGRKQILCAGGSSEDLGHIHNNIDTCVEHMHPAFRLYYLSPTEDGRGKEYGIKSKNNKSKVTTKVFIINLEGGTQKKKRESLAGFTPDEFILDEAMKFPFKAQLEALEPALWGAGVLRCNVLVTGTGGDEDLAVDAIKMLNSPKESRVCLMDWEDLERGVLPELITWKRRDYGLFLPTQMCIKHVKIKSNLADYLGMESETLKKVPLWVTDWKKAKQEEDLEREAKSGDKKSYTKLLAYHPYDPTEIFLSGKDNPFPVKEAIAHKEYLIRTGKFDRRRDLYRDSNGKIQVDISTKELAPFPWNGSNIEAPFLIFEDPPTEKVKWGTYTAGFDDYKHDAAENGSLGTFYVWKNEILGDRFSKRIVASLSMRPERHRTLHEKWLLLMEAYQLEGTCFGENEDFKIKDFLDTFHLTETYLATSVDFTQSLNLPNAKSRKYGWTPQSSKRTIFGQFVDHCNEDILTINDEGEEVVIKGVQTIDDIWLLEEIIQYTDNQNVDRICAAIGGLSFQIYLCNSYRWKVREAQQQVKAGTYQPKTRDKSFYSNSGRDRNFYRNKRG